MMNAVLVLDKPASLSSHDVVNRVRRITCERSVGHLGTLDPMATGVLPLLVGRYTRLAQFFNESSKTYEGEIRFGFATDTYDAEGEAVGPVSNCTPTLEEIRRQLPNLTGRISQTPPIYSAKKIGGVAAYKLARKDEPVAMKAVQVEVHRFDIQNVWGDRARFVAQVSAGTYIRSLAHNLGEAIGCGAHLSSLRRTQAGEFDLQHAVTLEELATYHSSPDQNITFANSSEYPLSDVNGVDKKNSSCPYLHPRTVLQHLPSVTAVPETIIQLRNGRPVNLGEYSDAPLVKVFANQTDLIAICQRLAGTLFHPKVVF